LADDPATKRDGNPYADWIAMYAGEEYQEVTVEAVSALDALMSRRGGPGRMPGLTETFRMATVLEADFWQMGLDAA